MKIKTDDLTIEEKIGQMLIVGIEGNSITSRTKELILKYKIGGIILYKKNFSTYDEMISLIKELKNLNKVNKIPLFISIDQEGGRVNRMPREFLNLPASGAIAENLGILAVEDAAEIIAEILSKSGINMNLAPDLDLLRVENMNSKSSNRVVGDRSFGENKKYVAKCGSAQIRMYKQKNVIPVIKHFPGHGSTKKDSHFMLPTIKIGIKELEKNDMFPFRFAIKNGADCMLLGHLKIKGVTGNLPCSLSKTFITKYIRRKYQFNGLVISDDLKMRAIKYRYGTTRAAIRAVNAGNDVIIFRFKKWQEKRTIEKLLKLAKNKKLDITEIDKSVERILNIKEKYNVTDEINEEKLDIEEINKRINIIKKRINKILKA